MINRLLVAGAGLAALSTAALAADLPRASAPPPPALALAEVAPPALWTGFYAGLNAGASINDASFRLAPIGSSFGGLLSNDDLRFLSRRGTADDLGFTGGGQAGYNFQIGGFVLGGEADFNYAGVETRGADVTTVPASFAGGAVGLFQQFNGGAPLSYAVAARQSVDWFGTARGRLGYATGPVLLYGTGGFAYGEVRSQAAAFTTPGDYFGPFPFAYGARDSSIRTGWTAGGGAEYALSRNFSLKAEYLYVDLGSKTLGLPAQGGALAVAPGSGFAYRDDARFQVVRAGVNYRW